MSTMTKAQEIKAGMPATHYVGSDSYAAVVVDVEYFKSGARKGEIKAIVACKADVSDSGELTPRPYMKWVGWDADKNEPVSAPEYDRFLPRVIGACDFHSAGKVSECCHHCKVAGQVRYESRFEGKVAYWSSLVVGYARDYRDPSF